MLFDDLKDIFFESVAGNDRRCIRQESEPVGSSIDTDDRKSSALKQEPDGELSQQTETVYHCAFTPFDLRETYSVHHDLRNSEKDGIIIRDVIRNDHAAVSAGSLSVSSAGSHCDIGGMRFGGGDPFSEP